MSHDFAKGRKAKKRPPATKKAARKKPGPAARTPLFGLVFIALFACAVLIAVLFALTKLAPRSDMSVTDDDPASETHFEFFTTLPEAEPDISTATGTAGANYLYYLQAGSFKALAEAESRRAELALLGYSSQVAVANRNGTQWHRVQIGPLDSRSKMAAVRGQLLENGYDTLVIKRLPED